jgi:hypothetical protein
MKKVIRLTEADLTRIVRRTIMEMESGATDEVDQEFVVNVEDIAKEDMKCFPENYPPGGRTRTKKRGCMTKTRYKGKAVRGGRSGNWMSSH